MIVETDAYVATSISKHNNFIKPDELQRRWMRQTLLMRRRATAGVGKTARGKRWIGEGCPSQSVIQNTTSFSILFGRDDREASLESGVAILFFNTAFLLCRILFPNRGLTPCLKIS
jgi:hypothetical protein